MYIRLLPIHKPCNQPMKEFKVNCIASESIICPKCGKRFTDLDYNSLTIVDNTLIIIE